MTIVPKKTTTVMRYRKTLLVSLSKGTEGGRSVSSDRKTGVFQMSDFR